MHWWVTMGYPDFDKGEDGFPRPGQVVYHFRTQRSIILTQRQLAELLGVTQQQVAKMENRDEGFTIPRRQALSRILNIPPVLLGIITVDEIENRLRGGRSRESIDIGEYQAHLALCWQMEFKFTAHSMVPNLFERMSILYYGLEHTRNKPPLQELLCNYHSLVARILTDQQFYTEALTHHDKALCFATSLEDIELIALNSHAKGCTLGDMHCNKQACKMYESVIQYERQLPPNLRFAILSNTGLHLAKNHSASRGQVMSLIDQAGNIARNNPQVDNRHVTDFSLHRYHITKGAALIQLGENKRARDELTINGETHVRRGGYATILEAQSYLNEKNYQMATAYAKAGLLAVQKIHSQVNVARVASIHKQLAASPYGKDSDVTRLGHLLGIQKQ